MSFNGQIVVDMDSHIREYEDVDRTYGDYIDPKYRDNAPHMPTHERHLLTSADADSCQVVMVHVATKRRGLLGRSVHDGERTGSGTTSRSNVASQSSSSLSRSAAPPSRPLSRGLGTWIIFAAGRYWDLGCRRLSRICAESGRSTGPMRIPVPVEETSEYVATVRSRNSTVLQPLVDGHVKAIFVKSGDEVKAGTALLQIDPVRQQASCRAG